MLHAVIASVVLGVVMTFGDYLWAALNIRHRVVTGVAHGAVMCLVIGAFIGWRSGRLAAGAVAGPMVGVLAAGLFYVLAPTLRYAAMFPAWMFFWICFAVLQERLGRMPRYGLALGRGLTAAALSGLAFYAISGIWTDPRPGGPDYARNLWSWTIAFLPGFVALFAVRAHRGGGGKP
jgi:hypothetical protein